MSINALMHKAERPNKKYPWIGVTADAGTVVVLFRKALCGTVLFSGDPQFKVGDYLEHWSEASFDQFTDRVSLEND